MQALQFSVTVPQWVALQDYAKMIEVNLKKEKHRAVKTVVSFADLAG